MPTLVASPIGRERIRQARVEKGWGWSTDDDDRCLIIASQIIDDSRRYEPGGPYASGISGGTWKRFLAGRHPIRASAFKAYCQAIGVDWRDVIARDHMPTNTPAQDWGEAPEVAGFCGRSPERDTLTAWVLTDRCRLIGLCGMGGIGKTSLAVKVAEAVQPNVDALIYRSLQSAPPASELVSDLLDTLINASSTAPADAITEADVAHASIARSITASITTLDNPMAAFMEILRDRRCLLILDDVETILQGGQLSGQYRDGYDDYGMLLRRIGTERHQSCLMVISREQPRDVSALATSGYAVREFKLQGMSVTDGKAFLESTGLVKKGSTFDVLIQRYRGNPSALQVVSKIVQEFFGSDVIQFMSQSTVFVTDVVTELLAQQIERLSDLERDVMYWLAIACQPISLRELKAKLWRSVTLTDLLDALQSLQRRSLIEKDATAEGNEAIFTLQPVVMKFVTTQFIHRMCQDIHQLLETQNLDHLGLLKSHALLSDRGDPDDLKPIQMRTILSRVCDRLYEAIHPSQIQERLRDVLPEAQGQPWQVVGYAEQNIKTLLNTPLG